MPADKDPHNNMPNDQNDSDNSPEGSSDGERQLVSSDLTESNESIESNADNSPSEQGDNDNTPPDIAGSSADTDDYQRQVTESNSSLNEESTTNTSESGTSEKPALKDVAPFNMRDPGSSPTFPVKLHMILSNPEFEKIVGWLPHGRAWRVLDHKALEEIVIPLYFRHGRYSSFARQINGWGFKRVVHGADYNAYYHEMFLRGKPELCARMRRPTSKNSATKSQDSSAPEPPDFYAMSRLEPLLETPQVSAAATHAPQAVYHVRGAVPAVVSSQSERAPPSTVEQLASLLRNPTPNVGSGTSGGQGDQLSNLLSLLNGGQVAAMPPPPPPPISQNQMLQRLLAGLSNQGTPYPPSPQEQLTSLLWQGLHAQQPDPQPSFAGFMNQNARQSNSVAELLGSLFNQNPMPQSTQQTDLLQDLMNQLQQRQASRQPTQPPARGTEQQGADKSSEDKKLSRSALDDASPGQSSTKRQRQANDKDVSVAHSETPQMTTSIDTSRQGQEPSAATTDTVAQLLSAFSPPDSSNSNNSLVYLRYQQNGGRNSASRQPQGNDALSSILSLLGQRSNQGFQGNSLWATLQQQGTTQAPPVRPQDDVSGLLQQLLGNSQRGQNIQPPSSASQDGGNLLRALQSLVAPVQTVAPPSTNLMAQLQQLLANRSPNPPQAAAPNSTTAMLEQLLSAARSHSNASDTAVSSNANPPGASGTVSANEGSTYASSGLNTHPPSRVGFNQSTTSVSGSLSPPNPPISTDAAVNPDNSASSDAPQNAQNQPASTSPQNSDNARAVATILTAFNKSGK